MTGFGSAENEDFAVEIRSLNHRFLDISIKMPPYMSKYEISLRNIIKEKFRRGRFDISISLVDGRMPRLRVNKEMAENIYTALSSLQKELSIPGRIDIGMLTEYREIFTEEEPEYDVNVLYSVFHSAVSNLESMRIQEGRFLTEEIRTRINFLKEATQKIKELAPEEMITWKNRFTEKLSLLLGSDMIDNNRILQEAAIVAEKTDISEELNRIENHLKQFNDILDSGDSVGKKLDFLLQEIVREANTLASKASDYDISKLVVEVKTEIEKIREQVQNIQ
ncbi:MAG: YicC/YloC family endoribonuclease [Nitrospirota bacterium]